MRKDPDKTRQLDCYGNITYNYKRNVYCTCMETDIVREMSAGGFEKDRKEGRMIKKLCSAKQYGLECKHMEQCSAKQGIIRIDITMNQRVFCPIDRASYKWKRCYKKRNTYRAG